MFFPPGFFSVLAIFDQQSENIDLWNDSGGYLNFIHDERSGVYMRFYVGQSFVLRRRIPYHVHQILLGSTQSLHYFLLAKGEGNRNSCFLKLWDSPACPWSSETWSSEQIKKEWDAFFANILEMAFCYVFQSLPADTLETYFGPSDCPDGYAGIGLNVISPLLQNIALDQATRNWYTLSVIQSRDADIQIWNYYRQSQNRKAIDPSTLARTPTLTVSQCQDILKKSFGQDEAWLSTFLDTSLEADAQAWGLWKQECVTALGPHQSTRGHDILFPYGELETARIGFIFDDAYIWCQQDEATTSSQCMRVPQVLQQLGFNARNCLIWNCGFHHSSNQELASAAYSQSANETLVKLNQRLIAQSCLKVIFCCGPDAMHAVSQKRGNLQQTMVQLGLSTFTMWIERLKHDRVFIYSPEFSSRLRLEEWSNAHRVEIAINFACKISSTSNIYPRQPQQIAARKLICRQARKEAEGLAKWTLQDLPLGIRIWLSLKGFQEDEVIQELERISGSLTRGLLTLLHVLPHRWETPKLYIPESKGLIARIPSADLAQISALRDFLDQRRQLNRPTDTVGADISVTDTDVQVADTDLQVADTDVRSETNPDRSIIQHQHSRAPRLLDQWATKRKHYRWYDGKAAQNQWESKYKDLGYAVRIPKPRKAQRAFGHRPLNFGYMTFYLPSTFDATGEYMNIHPEFSAEGERHSHVYATSSESHGHAQRLALRLEGLRKDGTICSEYAHSVVLKEVAAAERFAACLLEGVGIPLPQADGTKGHNS